MGICSELWLFSTALSFTVSNRLACFTREKELESRDVPVATVRAATAELDIGITPAARSSGGKTNRRLPFSTRSTATSLRDTFRIWASFELTLSGLGDSVSIFSSSLRPLTLFLASFAAALWLPSDDIIRPASLCSSCGVGSFLTSYRSTSKFEGQKSYPAASRERAFFRLAIRFPQMENLYLRY